MKFLLVDNYVYRYSVVGDSRVVKDIFWAHLNFIKLFETFKNVESCGFCSKIYIINSWVHMADEFQLTIGYMYPFYYKWIYTKTKLRYGLIGVVGVVFHSHHDTPISFL